MSSTMADVHAANAAHLTALRAALCMRRALELVVCTVAGAALAFAHAHEWLFPVALVAIGAFMGVASDTRSRGFGFLIGMFFGLSSFATGLPWLFDLLDPRDAAWTAWLLPLVLIAALSVPTAVVGACLAGQRQSRGLRLLLLAPAIWIAFDWLRHQGDFAFPWFSVGYSQIPQSPLAGYAPVGGMLLVGFVTVVTAGLLVIAVTRFELRQRALLAVGGLLAIVAALQQAPWTTPSDASLRVAVLQGNIGAGSKFDPAALSRTLARYESLIRSSSADVMLLPESALPLPAHVLGGYLAALRSHALDTETDVLVGAFEIDQQSGKRYSSAISLGPSGTQIYRKRQLVPFGDFVPWANALYESVRRVPFANTARGNADQLLPLLANGRVAIAICYDDAFGERMRADAAASGWIANLGNDGWGGARVMQLQHARMAQGRALEFGRPMLRATDTGQSGLIDERGRWVDALPLNEVGALEAEVTPRSGATPYARWGDRIALLACLFSVLAFVAHSGRRVHKSMERQ